MLTDNEGVTTTITNSYPLTSSTTLVADVENVERKLRYTVYVVVTNQFGESAKSAIADQGELYIFFDCIATNYCIAICKACKVFDVPYAHF